MGRYRDRYRADLMLILDGPLHSSGKPTLAFGARGNLVFQLTAFGPKFALHSGHYGNWAPNPAMDLVAAARVDERRERPRARDGFYDDVPPLSRRGAADSGRRARPRRRSDALLRHRPDRAGRRQSSGSAAVSRR